MREIWVEGNLPHREIAVIEDGKLCEYLCDDADRSSEAIILGRVDRIVPGMQAAFVDIGQEKNGFLPLTEKSETCVLPKLQTGMPVLVQIRKEAQGTKGAFLTRDITICGEYLIHMPMNRFIGVSAKLENSSQRSRLKKLGASLTQGNAGLVVRTSAADVEDQVLSEEYDRLSAIWNQIAKTYPTGHVPSVIHRPRSVLEMLLDDYAPRGIDCIRTSDTSLTKELGTDFTVSQEAEGFLLAGKWPGERDKALTRVSWLKHGGNLVIDRCEAMTVIDVNTAKFTGNRSLNSTALETNLEACGEIARQLRLRNVAGIIIIDMIDMVNEGDRKQVLAALQAALAADRIKTVIHGFTSLGLVEMTRKKSRKALYEEWSVPCPGCRGNGRLPKQTESENNNG